MTLTITPLYAGLLGLFYVALSLWVIKVRIQQRVHAGDKGDPVMSNAMRTHANFSEYVPLALLLIAIGEVQGLPGLAIHVLGALLFLARLMHAFGMGRMPHVPALRGGGAVLTFLVILAISLANLAYALK